MVSGSRLLASIILRWWGTKRFRQGGFSGVLQTRCGWFPLFSQMIIDVSQFVTCKRCSWFSWLFIDGHRRPQVFIGYHGAPQIWGLRLPTFCLGERSPTFRATQCWQTYLFRNIFVHMSFYMFYTWSLFSQMSPDDFWAKIMPDAATLRLHALN